MEAVERPAQHAVLKASSHLVFSPLVPGEKGYAFDLHLGEESDPPLPVTELQDQYYTDFCTYLVELFSANRVMSTCIYNLEWV